MKKTAVYKWVKRFSEGRESVTDEETSGRPATSRTEENIPKIPQIVRQNRRLTVRSITEQVNIYRETVRKILTEDLHIRKVCAKMVPKELTEEQKQRRVTICQDLLERQDGRRIRKIQQQLHLHVLMFFWRRWEKYTSGTFDVVSLPTLQMNAGALGIYVRALLMPKIMSKLQSWMLWELFLDGRSRRWTVSSWGFEGPKSCHLQVKQSKMLELFDLKIATVIVTSRNACPKTLRHIPQDEKFWLHPNI